MPGPLALRIFSSRCSRSGGLRRWVVPAAAFLLVGCQPAPEETESLREFDFGESPAGTTAAELLAVTSSGNETEITGFLVDRFHPSFRERAPDDEHLAILAQLRDEIAGREVTGVDMESPHQIALTFGSGGEPLQIGLAVDTETPPRITALSLGRPEAALAVESFEELDEYLSGLAEDGEMAGVVMVATPEEVRFLGSYGEADEAEGRSVTAATAFDIGSLTKLFTGVAALRLVERGELDLDRPIGAYLAGFPPEVAGTVTPRHLLQHRSGFGDYLDHPAFEADPQSFSAPEDYLPMARNQELLFEPGTSEAYSNLGYVVLGAILEQASGMGYHDLIDELVFQPAGMDITVPADPGSTARRYTTSSDGLRLVDDRYPVINSPAGGGYATADDLRNFVFALLGNRLLSPPSTATFLNRFREEAGADEIPQRLGLAGGAVGVNAVLSLQTDGPQVAIVLVNRDPPLAGTIARAIEPLM